MNERKDLSTLVAELQEEASVELARRHLADGIDPLDILNLCQKGMLQVGRYYEQGRYFIAGLIMAGEIMQRIGELVLPFMNSRVIEGHSGTILLGTVEGDIHFIGKDIFKVLIRGYGFVVHDLGVDVPASSFLAAIHEFKPDIVGFSCLISSAYNPMGKTIAFLHKNVPQELSPRAYLIGGLVDEHICRSVGASDWANDAMIGVRLCQKVMDSIKLSSAPPHERI
ncbi:MAG: hypothetical protein C4576_13760 [Desulfobacteraceae bacterium]|nr:MAG: hypothetical protein C4576_13760 [Desulfobacteraceae bacterium]